MLILSDLVFNHSQVSPGTSFPPVLYPLLTYGLALRLSSLCELATGADVRRGAQHFV